MLSVSEIEAVYFTWVALLSMVAIMVVILLSNKAFDKIFNKNKKPKGRKPMAVMNKRNS